jgi:DNA-binding response OmpR family regulator
MIVEDDKDMNKILSEIISEKGFSVSNFHDGNTALQQFKKSLFSLVILDYNLPNMTGLELLESIKSIDPAVKVLMISAHGDNRLKDKAREFGVKDFIDKPFDLKELNILIDECVTERNSNDHFQN